MNHQVINTKLAPEPVGPYNQAIKAQGSLIFLAGQIPLDPETGLIVGDNDITKQTQQVMSRDLSNLTTPFLNIRYAFIYTNLMLS